MSRWAGVLALTFLVVLAGCAENGQCNPEQVLEKITASLPAGWELVRAPVNSTAVFPSYKQWLVSMCEAEIKKTADGQAKNLKISVIVFNDAIIA